MSSVLYGLTLKNWQGKRIYLIDEDRRRPCTWGYVDVESGEIEVDPRFTTAILFSWVRDHNLTGAAIIDAARKMGVEGV